MRSGLVSLLVSVSVVVGCGSSSATEPVRAAIGQPAPDFTLPALDGAPHTLSALRGRTVVLEWFNPGCPYVQHAHGEGGALAGLAKRHDVVPGSEPGKAADGVAWLAINSGAPGKQGHGLDTNREAADRWDMDHPVLLDEDGRVGRTYGAATTPHLFVIDPAGTLVYAGAVDNRPLGRGEGDVVPFLERALADVAAGRPVATSSTKPYGCSVKY